MMMNATTKVSQIGWSFMYSLAPPSSCRHATAVGCVRRTLANKQRRDSPIRRASANLTLSSIAG